MKRREGRGVNCEAVKTVSQQYPRKSLKRLWKKKLNNLCQDKNLNTPFKADVMSFIFLKLPLSNSNSEA